MLKRITAFLSSACVLFTVLIFVLYIAGYAVITETIAVTPLGIVLLFAACLLLTAVNKLLSCSKIAYALRLLLHFLLTVAVLYAVFVLVGGFITTSALSLFLLAALGLFYCIFAAIFTALHKKLSEKEGQKEEYHSLFKK